MQYNIYKAVTEHIHMEPTVDRTIFKQPGIRIQTGVI